MSLRWMLRVQLPCFEELETAGHQELYYMLDSQVS
jgi:hypothetical protein